MIRGMTGWGKYEGKTVDNSIKIMVEIKTLNHKYLDVSLKLPPLLSEYEMEIRTYIKNKIKRGSVNVTINILDTVGEKITIDKEWVDKYKKLFNQMSNLFKINGTISPDVLIKLPHLIKMEPREIKSKEIYKIVKEVLKKAVNATIEMKEQEGIMLAKDMKRRVERILKTITNIEKTAPKRLKNKEKKLKIFFNEDNEENSKKYSDILFKYIDKYDIAEECTRLKHHCKLFLETIKIKESLGRRLNFITQEMLRESNSISAKAFDYSISKKTILIKEEIEKIREQIQNVE